MKNKSLAALTLCFSATGAFATNFGIQGMTYPIQEQNLLNVIPQTLQAMQQSGELDHINEEFKSNVKKHINRPRPVGNYSKTTEAKTFTVDPTQELKEDAITPDGVVIAKAGTKVNPFKTMSLTKHLLFIDGDDPAQVAWAAKYAADVRSKIILVNGSPSDVSKQIQQPIFFDQDGVMSRRWSLQHVPSDVYQQGYFLRVDEVVVND